jgi:lipoprotein-anchoring transpeptidase ErfK/SrfK
VTWTPNGDPASVKGYGYALSPADATEISLPDAPNAVEPSAQLTVPEDGAWRLSVRTLDNAGRWSEPTAITFTVDSVPLRLTGVKTRTVRTNPEYSTVPVKLTLSKPADVTVTVLTANAPPGGTDPLRIFALGRQEGDVVVEWDGRDEAGELLPAGPYHVQIAAQDSVGNATEAALTSIALTYKRIEISLARQTLWAYDADRVVLQTLITSGGPQTQTITGSFEVLTRQTPFTFKSPWPKGHPFWYPDSPATYAMLFEESGFFIHDAPWRGNFGPGSNLRMGTPGGDFTGTHGCINVPAGTARLLFNWSELGVPVIVR